MALCALVHGWGKKNKHKTFLRQGPAMHRAIWDPECPSCLLSGSVTFHLCARPPGGRSHLYSPVAVNTQSLKRHSHYDYNPSSLALGNGSTLLGFLNTTDVTRLLPTFYGVHITFRRHMVKLKSNKQSYDRQVL